MKIFRYGAVVVLLSGCASASQVAHTQATTSPAPSTAGPPASVTPTSIAPPSTGATPSAIPTQLGPAGGDQPGPQGQLYSKHAALLRAAADLALVHVPPGSVQQQGKLPAALTKMSEGIGAETAREDEWWTVPGTAAAVSAWILKHPPAGFVTGDRSGDIHGETTYDYDYPQGVAAPETLLGISVAQDGDRVDVRAQAQVVYLPTRTPVETIPASVTSAEAVYQPPNQGLATNVTPSPRRTATVTGADLRLLITTLNGLDGQSPVMHSCPAPDGEEAFVTFGYGGHRVVFHVELNGCGGVEVSSDGVPQQELRLDEALYAALHTALHVTKAEDPFLS